MLLQMNRDLIVYSYAFPEIAKRRTTRTLSFTKEAPTTALADDTMDPRILGLKKWSQVRRNEMIFGGVAHG